MCVQWVEAICDYLGKKRNEIEEERPRERSGESLWSCFWSWCLSTLMIAHRETPDGKRENERVEREIWGEEQRGRR